MALHGMFHQSAFTRTTIAIALLAAALHLPATAQNYMFGQTGLQTGTKPSGFAVADFNRDGRLDLAVVNQGDNTVSIILTKPDGTYADKVDYPVGNTPLQVVASDFNGDGIADLAVANSADNTVSLLFGVGDGTFSSQTIVPAGGSPVSVTAGDFNGDGNMDLATANQTDSTVSVLLGNGKGAFTAQTPVSMSAPPHYLRSGDMNNDGKTDILAVVTDPTVGDVVLLLTSSGSGSFSVAALTNGFAGSGSGAAIANIAIGDFNHDGNLDLAFSLAPTLVNSNFNAYVLLNTGTGSFTTETIALSDLPISAFSPPPPTVVAGDFNGDGALDLAVVQPGFVAIYEQESNGTFGSPILGGIETVSVPPVAAADFNNDGLLDIALVSPDYDTALILLGNGDGTLGNRYDISLPASGAAPAIVLDDLNNDGKMDIAVSQFNQSFPSGVVSGFVTSLLGNGDGTFQTPVSTPAGDIGIGSMIGGDITGDGNTDLVTADGNSGDLAVFLGIGNGTFGAPIDSAVAGGPTPWNLGPMAAGDFNGDGKVDVIVVSENSSDITSPMYVFLSQGDGTFVAKFVYNLNYGFVPFIAVADFNHDGFLDVAATTQNTLLVFLGRGDGTFQSPVSYSNTATFTYGVTTGDFNGDGKLDIVVGTSAGVLFYAGNGDGTFAPALATNYLVPMETLLAGDFNGDGILDLAGGPSPTFLLPGNGDGTFRAAIPYEPTHPIASNLGIAVGDMNGDGRVDIAQLNRFISQPGLGNPEEESITLWLASPTLSFTASSVQFGSQNVGTSSSPQTIQLSNVGNATLSLTKIASTGDFGQTNTCPSTLNIKNDCSIQVTFTPTANGPRTGTLTFADNAKPGTQSLTLTGWAGPPDFVPSVSPPSATVTAGSSANYSLSVTSGDGFAGTVQVACSGAPVEADCQLSQQSVSLSANGTARIQVTVTTTAHSSAAFAPVFLQPRRLPSTQPFLFRVLGIAFVFFFGLVTFCSRKRTVRLLPAMALSVVLVACGSGSGTPPPPPPSGGTPSGTYTLTLTMVSGSSTHASTFVLRVQ